MYLQHITNENKKNKQASYIYLKETQKNSINISYPYQEWKTIPLRWITEPVCQEEFNYQQFYWLLRGH